MDRDIIQSVNPVTLVGGGDATPADLHKALSLAPMCVAADGGAELVINESVELAAVIGDFDSLNSSILANIPANRQHLITEQLSTDFTKALSRIRAPLVLGVGFVGGRIDHQLAALHTLLTLPDRPCVLIGQDELIFLAPPVLELPTVAGDIVSLFPLGHVTGQSRGLEWPIDELRFSPARMIGTSNRATGPLWMRMDSAEMLVIVPRRLIQPVVQALGQTDRVRWPALS